MKRPERSTRTVVLFGSAVPGEGSKEYDNAMELGRLLASTGWTICNGGYGGTMAAVARGAKERGGSTIGVTTDTYEGQANEWIDEEIRMPDLWERMKTLITCGDAYVIMPGSTGTLAELATLLEMMNKGILTPRPVVLLGDYWAPLLELCEIKQRFSRFVAVAATPKEAVAWLDALSRQLREHGR